MCGKHNNNTLLMERFVCQLTTDLYDTVHVNIQSVMLYGSVTVRYCRPGSVIPIPT